MPMKTRQLDSSDVSAIDALMDAWTTANDHGDAKAISAPRALLRVRRNRVKSLEELQADIRSDQTINDMVRKQALDWAELFWKNRRAEPK
jgi:hypothetical protein